MVFHKETTETAYSTITVFVQTKKTTLSFLPTMYCFTIYRENATDIMASANEVWASVSFF